MAKYRRIDTSQFNAKIGAYTHSLRTGKGISQKKLASAVGVDASYISQLERGKISPTAYILLNLVSYFNLTIEEFVEAAYTQQVNQEVA